MTIQEEMLAYLRQSFDPETTLFGGSVEALPKHWRDYASTDEALRRFALRAELNSVAPYLPLVMQGLEQISIDAFLVDSPSVGICRIIVRQIKGKLYPAYSRLPMNFQSSPAPIWARMEKRAPRALTWLYRDKMDGLTDIGGLVGFKPTNLLTTMAAEVDSYGEQPWYDAYAGSIETNNIVELLASGSGGYLFIDLNTDMSQDRNPTGLFLFIDDGGPPETVLLFQYLDNWMEIGLVEPEE